MLLHPPFPQTSVSTSGVRPLRLPTFISLLVANRASSLANWTFRMGFLRKSASSPSNPQKLGTATHHCISPRCLRCRSRLRLRYSLYALMGFLLLLDWLVMPVAPVAWLSMDLRERPLLSLPLRLQV